jgi:hypothetical protein
VSGPNGFSQVAQFVSVSPSGNGTPRRATYQISAPGGSWDFSDGGAYNIAIVAGQVYDTAGNSVAASTLGSFTVVLGTKIYMPLIALRMTTVATVTDRRRPGGSIVVY